MHTEMLFTNTNCFIKNRVSVVTSFIHMRVEKEKKQNIKYDKPVNVLIEYS